MFFYSIAILSAQGENEDPSFQNSPDLKITNTSVLYDDRLEHFIFTIAVAGKAGKSYPEAVGSMDGAPVLGYVFPTTLKPADVGFSQTDGIVALAVTSHPDFDDTPLWDEDMDGNPSNMSEGGIWHPHWVVLQEDKRVRGGLSVKQFDAARDQVILPTTNPGMPMYMDSPGFHVVAKGHTIRVIVPAYRIKNKTNFQFDAVSAYMQVNASDSERPMLGVYAVYSIASGDLSLPYTVSY